MRLTPRVGPTTVRLVAPLVNHKQAWKLTEIDPYGQIITAESYQHRGPR